ncbi:MAG: hypothetical protein JNM76_18795 [Betaproteobacteria bacterium]|nr:hypothetical protein [Betaproteobacteria bacterium]
MSSALSGLFFVLIGEAMGRGPGPYFLVAVLAATLVMGFLQLVFMLSWCALLGEVNQLNFPTLYLSSSISAFALWLLAAQGQKALNWDLALRMGAFIGVAFLVMVGLFWLFSEPTLPDLNEGEE